VHSPADGVLAFHNGDVLVVANMGIAAAPLPEGYRLALASRPEAVTGAPSGSAAGTARGLKLEPNSAVYLLAG
jgi:alpha-glucosidase